MIAELAALAQNPRHPRFPRELNIAGYWINSYKVFLIVGLSVGTITTAALADYAGLSPLRVGLGAMACAVAGLAGARIYHVLVHARHYLRDEPRSTLWDTTRGGWGVFGSLMTFAPTALLVAWMLEMPPARLWDYMSAGILTGGFWIRLGCVFNGCCGGRETSGKLGVRLHDVRGVCKRRIPVQFFEMAWWLLGAIVFAALWRYDFPVGSYALGVLAWYGFGRFFLEPLREQSDVVFGIVRINQVVAALLALAAGGAILVRM